MDNGTRGNEIYLAVDGEVIYQEFQLVIAKSLEKGNSSLKLGLSLRPGL